MLNKKAQIWIETVIYTLIGLAIIGVVMGIVKPEIDKKKDSASIAQTIDILNEINSKVTDVRYLAGNSRSLQIKVSRGKIIFDGENDQVIAIIDNSRYQYSEIGREIDKGDVKVLTNEKGAVFQVTLWLNYSGQADIRHNRADVKYTLQPAPTVYNMVVKNYGSNLAGNPPEIDFS
jgi:hypothetical protein